MDAREVKVIDTSGRNGQPGVEFWEKKSAEGDCPQSFFLLQLLIVSKAHYGQIGQDGKSAGNPTAGQLGSDIRIRLAYANEEPGLLQVTGEGPHTGQLYVYSRVLFSAF